MAAHAGFGVRADVVPGGPLMDDVTRILSAIDQGEPKAAEQLLPLVYAELRRLATAKLAHEKPGQTLQATALVHEAYLRLVDQEQAQRWNSRRHFFAAAAEAMRRILVENARRKRRQKRGGDLRRVDLDPDELGIESPEEDVLDLNDALNDLADEDQQAAQFVNLRYFTGLSVEEAAEMVGLSRSAACEHWAFARAWLHHRLKAVEGSSRD
jgi:RNA polymerase sigma factor (TIGR02999 family)